MLYIRHNCSPEHRSWTVEQMLSLQTMQILPNHSVLIFFALRSHRLDNFPNPLIQITMSTTNVPLIIVIQLNRLISRLSHAFTLRSVCPPLASCSYLPAQTASISPCFSPLLHSSSPPSAPITVSSIRLRVSLVFIVRDSYIPQCVTLSFSISYSRQHRDRITSSKSWQPDNSWFPGVEYKATQYLSVSGTCSDYSQKCPKESVKLQKCHKIIHSGWFIVSKWEWVKLVVGTARVFSSITGLNLCGFSHFFLTLQRLCQTTANRWVFAVDLTPFLLLPFPSRCHCDVLAAVPLLCRAHNNGPSLSERGPRNAYLIVACFDMANTTSCLPAELFDRCSAVIISPSLPIVALSRSSNQ